MSQSQPEWNWREVSERFRYETDNAESYLNEVGKKVKANRNYELIFDEHLARFYVYNCLHGHTFLETRDMFVEELKRLIAVKFNSPIIRLTDRADPRILPKGTP
ncbi:MAG: hypothetical protein QME52_09795 [Bacteroidota bacterium]|nr:hypothetical protein [Bacteroidota bacterium]